MPNQNLDELFAKEKRESWQYGGRSMTGFQKPPSVQLDLFDWNSAQTMTTTTQKSNQAFRLATTAAASFLGLPLDGAASGNPKKI